jgi:hypothetical protein
MLWGWQTGKNVSCGLGDSSVLQLRELRSCDAEKACYVSAISFPTVIHFALGALSYLLSLAVVNSE